MSGFWKKIIPFYLIICVAFTQGIMLDKYFSQPKKLKVQYIKIRKSSDYSGAFLDYQVVVDFMHQHKVGNLRSEGKLNLFCVTYLTKYYKEIYPELKSYPNSAYISYDFENFGHGWYIELLD